MATQRYISTSFWDDPWVCTLDPSEKFVYLYLMTNPLTNIAGVYEITVRRICFDTGYNAETVDKILERFHKAGKALRWNDFTVIPSWPRHQKWETRKQIQAGIEKILRSLPNELLGLLEGMSYGYPMDNLSIPYQYGPSYPDKDLDLDSDKEVDTEEKKRKKRTAFDFSFIEDGDWRELWRHWVDNKEGRYTKQGGVSAGFTKLHNLSGGDLMTARAIVDESLANGWKGLFPLKGENSTQSTHNATPFSDTFPDIQFCQKHNREIVDGKCPMCEEEGI